MYSVISKFLHFLSEHIFKKKPKTKHQQHNTKGIPQIKTKLNPLKDEKTVLKLSFGDSNDNH